MLPVAQFADGKFHFEVLADDQEMLAPAHSLCEIEEVSILEDT
jgi:hypothetical protein